MIYVTLDCAWNIFRYFSAHGAPYEVSLHSRHKKELMISLAKVHIEMFDELKKSAMSVLSVNFNTFKSTNTYRNLWKTMKASKPRRSVILGKSLENLVNKRYVSAN